MIVISFSTPLVISDVPSLKSEFLDRFGALKDTALDSLPEAEAETLRNRINQTAQQCFEVMLAALQLAPAIQSRLGSETLTPCEAILFYVFDKNAPQVHLDKISALDEQTQAVISKVALQVLPQLQQVVIIPCFKAL
jgi:hypothetical protein